MSDPVERDLITGPRGLRIRVRHWGEQTGGRPLVILHGYLEQSAAWDRIAAALQPWRIAVPDHRGHGLSEHVGRGGFYHFWDYVADVDALIDSLGGEVDLVGHSMGGTMAALVAATVPAKIGSLILVEGLGPPDGAPRALEQARTALRHRRSPPRHKPVADLDDAVTRMRRGNPDLPLDVARELAARQTEPDPDATDGSLRWTWDALHRARSPQAFSADAFIRTLGAIEAPTLLVEGERSPYQGIPGLNTRRQAIPGARLQVISGCGHSPHHTHRSELIALIREHLHARA